MIRMRLWGAAAIIALVIIAGFVISVPRTRDVGPVSRGSTAETVPEVTFRDAYSRGTHTITGSVVMPDACGIVSAAASVATSSEGVPAIVLAVVVESGGGICLQLPTKADFKTTVAAPSGLPVTVTVNGALATTTLP